MTIKDVLRESVNGAVNNGKALDDRSGRWKKPGRVNEAAPGQANAEKSQMRVWLSPDRLLAYATIIVLSMVVLIFTLHSKGVSGGSNIANKTLRSSLVTRAVAAVNQKAVAANATGNAKSPISSLSKIDGWQRWDNPAAVQSARAASTSSGQYLLGVYEKSGSIARLWLQNVPTAINATTLASYAPARQVLSSEGAHTVQAAAVDRYGRTCVAFGDANIDVKNPYEIVSGNGFNAQSPYTISWISNKSVVTVGADTAAVRDAFASKATSVFP